MRGYRHDRGVPAPRLSGDARVRLCLARLLHDRGGGGRGRKLRSGAARRGPGPVADLGASGITLAHADRDDLEPLDLLGDAKVIVCSCAVISDAEIEQALVEILSLPDAPLPTPGVVYRHLQKKMVCCGCSPLAVSTIYQKIDELAERGLACPYACADAQGRLLKGARDAQARRKPAPAAVEPAAVEPA